MLLLAVGPRPNQRTRISNLDSEDEDENEVEKVNSAPEARATPKQLALCAHKTVNFTAFDVDSDEDDDEDGDSDE